MSTTQIWTNIIAYALQIGLLGGVDGHGRSLRTARLGDRKHRDHAEDRCRCLADKSDGRALCVSGGLGGVCEGGHDGCPWFGMSGFTHR